MDLDEAMRTQHACRYYRDDPVPDEVLFRAAELARFAPNGGNRCAVRFVFVRDERLRAQLGEWHLPLWEEVAAAARAGRTITTAGGQRKSTVTGFRDPARTMADTDRFARRFGEHPTFTTLLVAREPDVKELLGIPEHMSTACHIVAGYPARPFPRRLYRPDVSQIAFADRFGNSLT